MIAASGGADSTYLLLQACAWARRRGRCVSVVHLNHRSRSGSDGDEAFVAALCARLGVPLRTARAPLPPGSGNRQAAARESRRRALEDAAGPLGWILLGHQAWDLSESVTHALLKGKSLRALGNLRPVRDGRWLRPLLDLGGDEIRRRLERLGQAWREDASNAGVDFERNALRHRLLAPLRLEHGAELDRRLAALAADGADCADAEDRLRNDLLENLDLRQEYTGLSLERAGLFRYHVRIVEAALEALGRRLGAWTRSPGRIALAELGAWLLSGQAGGERPVAGGWRVALDRRRAWFWREAPDAPSGWLEPGGELSGAGLRFGRGPLPPEGAWVFGLLPDERARALRVRPWRPGDRLRLDAERSRSVADLLGEAGTNPLDKKRQTVLEDEGRLLALPGLRRAWCPRGEQRKCSTSIIWMVS